MINKPLDKIDLNDLNSLVQNAVPEGKTIEYKEKLPGNSDADRKEFLADISSFANTSGGDLIYGISTTQGIPKIIGGLAITNVDADKLRFEEIIRNGLEPRINFAIQIVPATKQRIVIIFRVTKGWGGPHRVILKGHDKFYARNSAGKYALDTHELRVAFNLSETVIDRINKFQIDRTSQLVANNTPVPFNDGGKIILQLIPLESFTPGYRVNLNTVTADITKLEPIYSMGWNHRINLEGLVSYSGSKDNESHTYVQLYRNGIIEAVEGLILRPDDERKYIPSIAYERELIKYLGIYLKLLKDLEVSPPAFVFLTLVGVKGFMMAVDQTRFWGDSHYPIDKDVLQLPETLVDSYDMEATTILKPMFDLIWNACGYEKSYNFDEQGNWVAK